MMPTVLNVNEAKANFSGVLAEVERNMLTITITRYGRPIARVVPIERKARSLSPIPGLAGKIKINCESPNTAFWLCRNLLPCF